MNLAQDPSYLAYLGTLEKQKGLPSGLLKAQLMAESGGDPDAVSPAGAQGPFQFMAPTAKQYGINPNDPMQAAQGAAQMMSDLTTKYNGDVPSALAAYNWGQGNVDNKGVSNAPAETQGYIQKITSMLNPVQPAQAADNSPVQSSGNTIDVEMPDGTVIQDVPEGITKDQLQQMVSGKITDQGPLRAATSAAEQAMTLGLADPLYSAATAGRKSIQDLITGDNKDKSFLSYYDQKMNDLKGDEQSQKDQHPTADAVGSLAGFLGALGMGTPEATATEAAPKGFLQRIGDAGVNNAKFMVPATGLAALGNAEGTPEERLEQGATGAAIGGAASFALPALGEAVGAAGKLIKPKVNQEALAGRGLELAGGMNAEDAASGMSQALDSANATAKTVPKQAWKAAGVTDTMPAATQPLKNAFKNYTNGLAKAEKSVLPQDIVSDIDSLGTSEPLSEIQAIRSKLGDNIRTAYKNGENNKGRILSGVDDLLKNHAETPDLSGATPEQTALYQQARNATRDYKTTFNQPDVRKALGVDKYGFDKLPESSVANHFIKAGKGGAEAWQGYMNALSKAEPDVQATGMDASRAAFSDKFLNNVSNGTPKAINKFAGDYSHIIQSPLLTDAQRQTVTDVANSAIKSKTRTSGRLIDLLKNRVVTGVIGAATGDTLDGTRGAIEGGLAGLAGATTLSNAIRGASSKSVSGLIGAALKDPEVANALQMKASQIAEKEMSPSVLNKITTILSNRTNRAIATTSGLNRKKK